MITIILMILAICVYKWYNKIIMNIQWYSQYAYINDNNDNNDNNDTIILMILAICVYKWYNDNNDNNDTIITNDTRNMRI